MKKLKIALCISLALNLGLVGAIAFATKKLGGPSYLAFKVRDGDGGTGIGVGRLEHLQALDARSSGKIVFVGDSITEAAEWDELLSSDQVVNRGIGGDSTSRILARIAGIAQTKPAKIFIMAGINDLATQTHDEVAARYAKIIATIKQVSPATRIFIQSTLPVNNSVRATGRNNAEVAALNAALIRLSDAEDQVDWIDVRPELTDEQGNLGAEYTHDGLHLNGKAYVKWGSLIRRQVEG